MMFLHQMWCPHISSPIIITDETCAFIQLPFPVNSQKAEESVLTLLRSCCSGSSVSNLDYAIAIAVSRLH